METIFKKNLDFLKHICLIYFLFNGLNHQTGAYDERRRKIKKASELLTHEVNRMDHQGKARRPKQSFAG
jgi:hypothetical protein